MDAVPVRRLHAQRWRPLTAGEIAMASLLFRDAIDYARVRVFNRRYLPYLQPKNCAMTPNGSIYFHHSCFLDDYAEANLTGRHWFMHEMVLLWQSAHRLIKCVRLTRTSAVINSTSYLSCEQCRHTLRHSYRPRSGRSGNGINRG